VGFEKRLGTDFGRNFLACFGFLYWRIDQNVFRLPLSLKLGVIFFSAD